MPGIHRERPGADAIAAATDAPAIDLGDGIWLHEGLSNTYMLQTDEGRVLVNAGMGFEGPLHRAAYDAIDQSPVGAVILTQGHYDHVGGIDVVRDPGSDVIAQANYDVWRQDNALLEGFRSRNSAFAWISAIVAAMEALWPKPVVMAADEGARRDTTWRFSARWWAKPLPQRRDRPFR